MARSRGRAWDQDELDVFLLFGVVPTEPGRQVQRVLGSGFVISAAGEILTNNHVIEGADTIEVSLFGNDRKRYHAVLVGRDPLTDSALIRLENPPLDLPAVTLGHSSALTAVAPIIVGVPSGSVGRSPEETQRFCTGVRYVSDGALTRASV